MERKYAEGTPELGEAKGGGFGVAEGAELAGTGFDDVREDLIGQRGSGSAGARGEREDMQIGEGVLLDEGESGFVVSVGLAGEAGDDIGADGGVRQAFVNEFEAASVVGDAITAVHGGEDAVGAGLQRHVEVLREAAGRGEEINEVLCNILRLDGRESEAVERCFVEDATQ
jgi:hypothetical protein